MKLRTVRNIRNDWYINKLTHGQIQWKYDLSDECAHAIFNCSEGLSDETIVDRIQRVKDDMSEMEIRLVMAYGNVDGHSKVTFRPGTTF